MISRAAHVIVEQTGRRNPHGREVTRVLKLLGADDSGGLTMAVLRENGVQAPTRAIYELQLAGCDIDLVACESTGGRKTLGYRLNATPPVRDRSVMSEERGDAVQH
jgi:hypothetical protein